MLGIQYLNSSLKTFTLLLKTFTAKAFMLDWKQGIESIELARRVVTRTRYIPLIKKHLAHRDRDKA
jgi:hypothetical protein